MLSQSASRAIIFSLIVFALCFSPVAAQDNFRDVVEMSLEIGFGGYFRPGEWTPVRVELANHGESLRGRLVVRPETSGRVVGNAFSRPIDLPSGSQKSATLYIQARSFPDSIRVELIDEAGLSRAWRDGALYDIGPHDQLHVVIAGPNATPPGLSGAHVGGVEAQQVIWRAHQVPELGAALRSLDMLMLLNIDSASLSRDQVKAIRHYVEEGGHLIVNGGPSALITAAAFEAILPLSPSGSRSIDDLSALARFIGDRDALAGRAIVALGELDASAEVLAAADGLPLVARRRLGAGLVDFLAADPSLAPLADWAGLNGLWLKLMATRPPHPAWREGFTRPDWAAEAVANLPGVDLLPPMQALCIFLGAYILLIGPLNYLVLSRLRRNGWGWLTIPLIILCFTGIAWTVGFNLRGTEVIVSRLTVAQSFVDQDEAQVDQVLGMLSPRRATYSLTLPEGSSLAVAGATSPSSIFASNTIQTGTEIRQASRFGAQDFTIDGGIFANFSAAGRIPKPAISGGFTLGFETLESGRLVRVYHGALRNESDITLRDVRILGPGFAYRLEGELAPGDILTLSGDELRPDLTDAPAQPNPLELFVTVQTMGQSPFSGLGRNTTIKQIQGERYLRTRAFLRAESIKERQAAREQSFLASFSVDQFLSDGRGAGLYLAGWSDSWARDLEIEGAAWSAVDTSLYLIELDVDIELPGEQVTLSSDYFSWMTLEREGLVGNGTDNFSLFESQSVEFLFHPLPGLALDEVTRLYLKVDRGGGYAQMLPLEVYDWEAGAYEKFGYREGDELELAAPAAYLGAGNAVRLRLEYNSGSGTARVRRIRLEQTGRYHRER